MKLNKLTTILSVVILSINCGFYSLKGTLPANVNSMVLPPSINETSEYSLNVLLDKILLEELLVENILTVSSYENADSKLDIIIKKIIESPDVISSSAIGFETVNQWKLSIEIQVIWKNLNNGLDIINKTINEHIIYSYGKDIGLDGIDNDLDGYIDEKDDDEYGLDTPRKGAINMCINSLSNLIVKELTSTW